MLRRLPGIRSLFNKSLPLGVRDLNNEMKNQFILLLLLINLSACDVFRPATRRTDNLSAGTAEQTSGSRTQVGFIRNISTESSVSENRTTGATSYEGGTSGAATTTGNEPYDPLQFKYAILTNSPVEELTNRRLLAFMDQWYGVPYHWGGNNKEGIDCSAFTCQLVSDVYNVKRLPRMSADQYKATRRVPKKELKEGDLVFFHTMGRGHRITHVGVYLYNNRFVHASIAGVQISDLGQGYYYHHYVGAGRITE
jgi:cell wall-associated NlpC family hydrolase